MVRETRPPRVKCSVLGAMVEDPVCTEEASNTASGRGGGGVGVGGETRYFKGGEIRLSVDGKELSWQNN